MGASRSPEAELGHEYSERVSGALFRGAGVSRIKARGRPGLQFRVTNLTNCSFMATRQQLPCRRLN